LVVEADFDVLERAVRELEVESILVEAGEVFRIELVELIGDFQMPAAIVGDVGVVSIERLLRVDRFANPKKQDNEQQEARSHALSVFAEWGSATLTLLGGICQVTEVTR
jgi:hypothetical protein